MISQRAKSAPSYEVLLLISCAVGYFGYFCAYMRIPVVPLFAGQLGAETFQVGLINASFLFLAGALSLPMGILSDRIGRKLLILWGLSMSMVTSFVLVFCKTPEQMILAYVFFGLGQAALAPTLMSYATDISPVTHMGRTYGWYTLAIYAGMSTGPAAGGMIAHWLSFQAVFAASGTLILALLVMAIFFLPRARDVALEKPPKLPFLIVARELVTNVPLMACWLVTLGACTGMGTFLTFVPLHAKEQGVNIGQIGLIFAAQALFNALSRLPFGYLSDRITRRNHLVVAGLTSFALCMAGVGAASSFHTFILFAAVMGFSMGTGFTAIGTLMTELVGPSCRGLAMGGYNGAIYLGMMLGALVMGAIAGHIGFRNSFFMIASMNLTVILLFHVIFKKSQKPGTKP